MRLLRRKARDPRVEAARGAYADGDFAGARDLARAVVADGDQSLEALRGLAELEYLLGDYPAAEALLHRVVQGARKLETRADAEGALALVYLQTNRFSEARGLFAGIEDAVHVPIWELMRSFGDETPYRIDWSGKATTTVAFTQTTSWELPSIPLAVGHLEVEARLDTGGDLLVLSTDVAEALALEPVVTTTGTFAGGATGDLSYARVEEVTLGGITVRGVPVSIVALDRPVLGTGFLRQFLATLDYPEGRLVLRPRGSAARAAGAVEVPFALALVHLIVARGSLDDEEPLTFILDSGLQDEEGSAFAAPAETLVAAAIPLPETREERRESGAGHVPLQVGRFPIRRLGLGGLVQHDLTGFFGAFPDVWRDSAGFRIDGIVSHGFLRRYAWTLDFDTMTMTFAEPL